MTGSEAPVRLDPFSLASPALLAVASMREGTWVLANAALAHVVGMIEAEIVGAPFARLLHPEDAAAFRERLPDIAAGERPCNLRMRLRRDGAPSLPVTWTAFAVANHVFLCGSDVATAGGPGASSPEAVPPLLAEVQHRARNTLGVVRSIARRTARTSGTVDDFAAHLDGRLGAYARVQGAILRSPVAGLALDQLVADELAASAAHEGESVSIHGPSLHLRPRLAEALGLALHELATNAIEHGALAAPAGRLEVSWTVSGEGEATRLHLRWREEGRRGRTTKPKRRGFGLDFLERSLPYELKATTRWLLQSGGLFFEADIPLAGNVLADGAAPSRVIGGAP